MYLVNIERGKAEAIKLAKVLDDKKVLDGDGDANRDERTLLVNDPS